MSITFDAPGAKKVYKVLLSADGAGGEPSPLEIVNSLGDVPSWTNTRTGEYEAELTGAFAGACFFNQPALDLNDIVGTEYYATIQKIDNDTIQLLVFNSSGVAVDGFNNMCICIEVYPS